MGKTEQRRSTVNAPSRGGTFGEDVRKVREARNMTTTALARATGYSKSYVSKVEHGTVVPKEKFAAGCDMAFGTGDLFVRTLRRIVLGEHPSWFAPFIEAERKADTIEDYSTVFIFGLLQTPEYARAALEMATPGANQTDLDASVAGRIRRREILKSDNPPRVWVVLHEACLHSQVGTPAVMAAQLAYLHEAVRRYNTLTLQVLPYTVAAASLGTPFTVLRSGSDVSVHVEGPQGGRPYEDASTLTNTREIYDRMRACALSLHDSLARIDSVRDEYERYARVDQVQLLRRPGRQLRRVGPGSHVRRRGPRPGQ